MADYLIKCSACQSELSFPDVMMNESVECPTCGADVHLTCPPAVLTDAQEDAYEEAEPEASYQQENVYAEDLTPEEAYAQQDYDNPIPLEGDSYMSQQQGSFQQSAPQQEAVQPLPERMKANKLVVDRICPICDNTIDLGDDVYNCQKCYTSMHNSCHDDFKYCGNSNCEDKKPLGFQGQEKKKLRMKKSGTSPAAGADADEMACKFCGEMIKKGARKCRFCGEFQREFDRKRMNQEANAEDESLTVSEIIFGLICGGLACIVSIVWICQGKKKGWKLLGLSILSQIVWGFIRAMLEQGR